MNAPPWSNWLAVGLDRYVKRRAWMAEHPVPETPLKFVDFPIVPKPWGQPHPKMEGWRFARGEEWVGFRGPGGEILSFPLVDGRIPDGAAEAINGQEFALWLASQEHPPENWLHQWFGGLELIPALLRWAEAAGLVLDGRLAVVPATNVKEPEFHGFPEQHYQFLLALAQEWRAQAGLSWERMLGDLHQVLGAEPWLNLCERLLEAPPDAATPQIVTAYHFRSPQKVSARILEFLEQVAEEPELAQSVFFYLRARSAAFREFRLPDLKGGLAELAILALEFAPAIGRELIRQCLDGEYPIQMARFLGELRQDWCLEELDRALSRRPADDPAQPHLRRAREESWQPPAPDDPPELQLWQRKVFAVVPYFRRRAVTK